MTDFKFTPEDFNNMAYTGTVSMATYEDFKLLAECCNDRLKEWLDKSPTVYGQVDSDTYNYFSTEAVGDIARHKAKLVCIEEIK